MEKHPISNYWAAVILADKFEDADFERHKVDFSNTSGSAILTTMERMFYSHRISKMQKPNRELSDAAYAQLMAFMGSRGVKTSALKTSDETWQAAMILWPSIKRGADLADLVSQIRGFSKAQRKIATGNVKKLPENWIA